MFKKTSVMLLFLALLMPAAVRAHDPSKHKGKGIQGEIVSITNDRIQVKTSTGTLMVSTDDKTKFERGNHQVTKADLKKGDQVTIFGTKLSTDELVAREILLTSPEHPGNHKEKSDLKH